MKDAERINQLVVSVANSISELRQIKRNNPGLALGYSLSYGGILNAYREGDISFKEAVHELRMIDKKDTGE